LQLRERAVVAGGDERRQHRWIKTAARGLSSLNRSLHGVEEALIDRDPRSACSVQVGQAAVRIES
jgi:hypothetical protein